MKKIMWIALAACGVLAAADRNPDAFVTHTELSYVQTGGNTDTTAFALDFKGKKEWGAQSAQLDLDAIYGTEDKVENKNRFYGEFNYNWQFAKHFTVNYVAGYKRDRFSGFDYQFFTGPGAKYIALDDKVFHLDFQGNVLYNIDETMKKYYDANGDEIKYPYPDGTGSAARVEDGLYDDYYGALLKGNFSWVIVEGFKFVEEASYRVSFDDVQNYFIFSKTGFESKISDMFSLGVSYKANYANLPPEGNKRLDTTFMTSLIIDY